MSKNKPKPLDLEVKKEIREIGDYIVELLEFYNLSKYEEKELKETLILEIDDLINRVIKQRIKEACEFWLRYKDKPELLMKDYPLLLEKMVKKSKLMKLIKKDIEIIKVFDGSIIAFLKDKSGLSFSKKEYNDWLFKLAFKSVLEEENKTKTKT